MRKLKKNLGLTIFILLMGLIIGTLLGEVFNNILPHGAVRKAMTESISIGFHPLTIDLYIIQFTFGLMFKLNLFGVIGILLLGYSLKWLY